MPVSIGQQIPQVKENTADITPAYQLGPNDKPLIHKVLISMEDPLTWPADFYSWSKEEQEKFISKYRFQGIRLRSDIKDKTIPLSRETMDIP